MKKVMIILVDPFVGPPYIVSFIALPQETFLRIKYLKFTYRHGYDLFPYNKTTDQVQCVFLNK